jgi:hypothetical protein
VQLLRRCAEDAKRDEKQWAALSGELDPVAEVMETGVGEGFDTLDTVFQSGNIGDATRLIEVFRSSFGAEQITAGSEEVAQIIQCLSRFEQTHSVRVCRPAKSLNGSPDL